MLHATTEQMPSNFKYLVKNINSIKTHNIQYLQFIRLDNEMKLYNILNIELNDFISITKLMVHQTYSTML